MSFLNALSGVLSDAKALAQKYTPESLSPEKRFGKACVTVCALVTMADGDAEESEIDMAAEFLGGIDEIKDYIGIGEANEIFGMQIVALQSGFSKGKGMFAMEVNKLIGEIKSGVTDAQWQMAVIAVAEAMASSNSRGTVGDDEQVMLNKLTTAIG